MASRDNEAIDPSDGPPPAPRWVKVVAVIAGIFAIALVVLLLAGGNHGPGRHSANGGTVGSAVVSA